MFAVCHFWGAGTTLIRRQKGVLIPETALAAQASSLLEAWKYSPQDRLLHLLPLHHIHGTINALVAPLVAGSCIEFMYPFNTEQVWSRFAAPFLPSDNSSGKQKHPITFLTAVPTVYNRLMNAFPNLTPETQQAAKKGIAPENLRLNISGSAALPTPTKAAWANLSNGNVLLERFGMTEVGMALSCGLDLADRVNGSVGWPLPGVEVRLVDTETEQVIQPGEEVAPDGRTREGEIQLRGATLFSRYWANEKATHEAFVASDDDGTQWFNTGDVATRHTVEGAGAGRSGPWARGPMYFIRGRKSVDIIKTGGEKVSALEVERELLSMYVLSLPPFPPSIYLLPSSPLHLACLVLFTAVLTNQPSSSPHISETAVVGLPSEQWGQKVAAIVVLHPSAQTAGRNGKPWGAMDMRRALRGRLAAYKVPQEMKVLDAIPRNAMGKGESSILSFPFQLDYSHVEELHYCGKVLIPRDHS